MRLSAASLLMSALLAAAVVTACSSNTHPTISSDAGTPIDAGTGTDAGTHTDAGTGTDAGTHTDGGTGTDAGTDAGSDGGITSGGGDGGVSFGDGGMPSDGGVSSDGGTCTASLDYGSVNPGADQQADYDSSYDVYELQAALNQDASTDVIFIQLYNTFGVFTNGVVPGTYTISGDETNFSTCGLCILIGTNVDSSGTPTDTYFATGGTVTITEVTPVLSGTLTNVTFTHVTIDSTTNVSTPVGDGCNAQIDYLVFSAVDGSTDGGTGTDGGVGVDGGTDGGVSGSCTATADYGTIDPGLVSSTELAAYSAPSSAGGTDDFYALQVNVNTDASPDLFYMELDDGYGAFVNGIAPGTYTLSGDELDPSTCGLCLVVYTDTDGSGDFTDTYFATGGTVTITSVTPTLAGSITNVTFTHVTIDSTTGKATPVSDGCNSKIESLVFSADDSGGTDGGVSGACTATADYGTIDPTLVSSTEVATYNAPSTDGGTDDFYDLQVQLNSDASPDLLDLELDDGYGVFANGIAPGTYTIAGAELDPSTCGLCLLIGTNLDANDNPTDLYFATGGTVTITSVTPTLAGSITNATFQHVTIDSNTGMATPVGDGCTALIEELDFSAAVTTGGGTSSGACTASAMYGAVMQDGSQTATYYPGSDPTGDSYEYDLNLDQTSTPNLLDMQLYAGAGVFAAGAGTIQPGTYTLSGDDLDPNNCGLCVAIFTQTDGQDYTDLYFATGGTVTITSLNPTLAGSLSGLTFQHVIFDDDGNAQPAGDGCDSSVDSLAYSVDVMTSDLVHASSKSEQRHARHHAARRHLKHRPLKRGHKAFHKRVLHWRKPATQSF